MAKRGGGDSQDLYWVVLVHRGILSILSIRMNLEVTNHGSVSLYKRHTIILSRCWSVMEALVVHIVDLTKMVTLILAIHLLQ